MSDRAALEVRTGSHGLHFTRAYAETRPVGADRLALWEIFVGAAAAHSMGEWGLEPEREREMRRRTGAFIHSAAARLLAQRGD